ncbi:hypothetical protein GGF31_003680 [Allomyces arbusculus]|nr:hypothetical protein GGF31_003680 [Allomyces arbusculus]
MRNFHASSTLKFERVAQAYAQLEEIDVALHVFRFAVGGNQIDWIGAGRACQGRVRVQSGAHIVFLRVSL